jgi:hypothetical protein
LLAGQAEPSQIATIAEPLVAAMLFVNEARLSDPISGTSGFHVDFESRGPFDGDGRSLRRLDLTRRLFYHPMSFLVYSEAFDGLPTEAKEQVFRRVWEVLWGSIEASFREYGLPARILSDNGASFASTGIGGLSRLSV